jgi:hypothetical protein
MHIRSVAFALIVALAATTGAGGAGSGMVTSICTSGQSIGGSPTCITTNGTIGLGWFTSGKALCGSSCGNSAYQSIVGTDYNASPNRPGDYTDGACFAIYFNGSQTAGEADPANYGGNTYAQISQAGGLISQAATYAAGGASNIATALAWLDNDYRAGTGGATGQSTLSYVSTSIYPGMVSMLTANWPGMKLYAYEGGLQPIGPSAAWLASQGDSSSTTDAANIASLIAGYRSSPYALAIAYDYWQQFLNANAIVAGCAWLTLEGPPTGGGGQWSLAPGFIVPSPFTAYQMYWGICTMNHQAPCNQNVNYLLRRDLDPAMDDNSPTGLPNAA